jgi:uncharacterized protein YkwD
MDWLKLTETDINEAARLAAASSPAPAVIRIGPEDLEAETPAPPRRSVLRISSQDLLAGPPRATPDERLEAGEKLMFNLINEVRSAQLPRWLSNWELQWHAGLAAVARGHSMDMLQRQYVQHDSPEGVSAANRIERFGIRYLACGENIGVVYGANSHSEKGIYDIHSAFMDQPASLTNHRGNVLNPIWTHVGVGGAYSEDGTLIITQNYMSAPGSRNQNK